MDPQTHSYGPVSGAAVRTRSNQDPFRSPRRVESCSSKISSFFTLNHSEKVPARASRTSNGQFTGILLPSEPGTSLVNRSQINNSSNTLEQLIGFWTVNPQQSVGEEEEEPLQPVVGSEPLMELLHLNDVLQPSSIRSGDLDPADPVRGVSCDSPEQLGM